MARKVHVLRQDPIVERSVRVPHVASMGTYFVCGSDRQVAVDFSLILGDVFVQAETVL